MIENSIVWQISRLWFSRVNIKTDVFHICEIAVEIRRTGVQVWYYVVAIQAWEFQFDGSPVIWTFVHDHEKRFVILVTIAQCIDSNLLKFTFQTSRYVNLSELERLPFIIQLEKAIRLVIMWEVIPIKLAVCFCERHRFQCNFLRIVDDLIEVGQMI